MTLKPLVEKKEIKETLDSFAEHMSKDSKHFTRTLGWQGGNGKGEVFWNESLEIWSCFDPNGLDNRNWCGFGVQDPSKPSNLSITCEINFPKEGINLQVSGLFVRDNKRNVYITHNGNLRGGKKGVGKESHRRFVPEDQFVDIALEDGKGIQNILIGRLDDPELPKKVASFVKRANSFKEKVASGELPKIVGSGSKGFSPEFYGQRESYCHADIIVSRCDHGTVVNSLSNQVENRGLKVVNDSRDLYICGDDEDLMTVLFEAKTDLSTSSIYSAIGQLMYYSASQDPLPKLVMVLPDKPREDTKKILDRLGIKVLQYKLKKSDKFGKDDVHFIGLDSLLKTIT